MAGWFFLSFKGDWWNTFSCSSTYMGVVLKVFELVEFARLAVSSNLFGLGCPFYCGSSSIPSLLLSLVLGFVLGFCSCLLILFYIYRHCSVFAGFPKPSSTSSRPAASGKLRLQGYSL